MKTWVYPTNLGDPRDYQFNIVQRGLYHNTLVALPTGLGKDFHRRNDHAKLVQMDA